VSQIIDTFRQRYRNLLAENPQLQETSFERIFCYQLDKEVEGSRKDYNLNTE